MTTPQQEIRNVLATMFDDWNGERQQQYFLNYWPGEDMRWSMKGRWYKGLASMRQVYQAGFPPGAMGITTLFDIDVIMLAEDIGIATYHWTHEFEHECVAGATDQVFRKKDDRWLVVCENSARVPVD